ncbi:hypothetical protein [Arthrobacter sp.]|uniref:TetR/AcrR family transcriptional regulator n=1 Tax=Arthrobacter sp. TaxID=1667 RepID=UPI00289795B6|nr:hypothetical protein [Arthrobacter sp.]
MERIGDRVDLLDRVIDAVAARGLERSTFRSLATDLGISTFPLVSTFGTKEDLLATVVQHVEKRQADLARTMLDGDVLDAKLFYEFWNWCVSNVQAMNLDLEIILHQRRSRPEDQSVPHSALGQWLELWTARYRRSGYSEPHALQKATLMTAVVWGLQLDLVITGDTSRVTAAYVQLVDQILRELDAGPADSDQAKPL